MRCCLKSLSLRREYTSAWSESHHFLCTHIVNNSVYIIYHICGRARTALSLQSAFSLERLSKPFTRTIGNMTVWVCAPVKLKALGVFILFLQHLCTQSGIDICPLYVCHISWTCNKLYFIFSNAIWWPPKKITRTFFIASVPSGKRRLWKYRQRGEIIAVWIWLNINTKGDAKQNYHQLPNSKNLSHNLLKWNLFSISSLKLTIICALRLPSEDDYAKPMINWINMPVKAFKYNLARKQPDNYILRPN